MTNGKMMVGVVSLA